MQSCSRVVEAKTECSQVMAGMATGYIAISRCHMQSLSIANQ